MQKVMFSLWKPLTQSSQDWRDSLLNLGRSLVALGGLQIRFMVVDEDVQKASIQRMTSSASPLDGMLSLRLNIASMLPPMQEEIAKKVARMHAYHVEESVPCPEQRQTRQRQLGIELQVAGTRTPGMCQLALFKRPARLSQTQWTHYWRDCHGFNAYALQAIFDCRQNLVVRALSPDAPEVHAIVEEHYPQAAIGDVHAYYGTQGNTDLLHEREQALSESVCSFMDFSSLDCVLTSFYQVST